MLKHKLKNLIEQKGLTQAYVAEKSGINRTDLSSLLHGRRNLTEKMLNKILIGAFNMRPSEAEATIEQWKFESAAEKLSRIAPGKTPQLSSKEDFPKFGTIDLTKEFASVPRLGHVVCGPFRDADIIGKDFFDQKLIKENKRYFSLVADGISMIGKIDPGDIVLIEQTTENIPGKIMLFGIREEYSLGYLYQDEEGFMEVRKANRDFAPIKVNDPEFRIAGVVRAIFKKM